MNLALRILKQDYANAMNHESLTALSLIVPGLFRKKRVSIGNARAAKRARQYEVLRR